MKTACRVLQVGVGRQSRGGVSSFLQGIARFRKLNLSDFDFLEVQGSGGYLTKFKLLFSGFVKTIWRVPLHDIVHFHSTPGNCLLIQFPILLYSKLCFKKVIVHIHVGNQICHYRTSKLFYLFLRLADRVVVLAKVFEASIHNMGISPHKVSTIYNPAPAIIHSSNKSKILLYAAFMDKNKGYDTVIRAFARIASDFPAWRLIMAGTGETDQARELVKQLGAEKQIEIKEWVEKKEKHDLFMKASVYCMASEKEGFPMSVLEAWAYGLALVSTTAGGLVDVLENNKNALVFSYNDSVGLSRQLWRIFQDESLRLRLSEESWNMAQNVFSSDATEDSLLKLYGEIM